MRICVVGSGLTALAAAFYAARAGARVCVAPSRSAAFPLEQHFEFAGERFARFHEPLRSADTSLCGFLMDLGLLSEVTWREAPLRILRAEQGLLRPFSLEAHRWSAREARTRWALRRMLHPAPLSSDEPARAWLTRRCGPGGFQRLAGPLITAACGEGMHDITARTAQLVLRSQIRGLERQGVVTHGPSALFASVRDRIAELGVELADEGAITCIAPRARGEGARVSFGETQQLFDAVICTEHPAEWTKLLESSDAGAHLLQNAPPPEGVVSVVAVLDGRGALEDASVLAFGSDGYPFSWMHAPRYAPSHGRSAPRPVYLVHRGPSHLRPFRDSDDTWKERARAALEQLAGTSARPLVQELAVFRLACTDSLAPPCGSVPERLPDLPVFPTAAHGPIRPRGLEAAIMAARDTVQAVLRRARAAGPRAPVRGRSAPQRRSRTSHGPGTVPALEHA